MAVGAHPQENHVEPRRARWRPLHADGLGRRRQRRAVRRRLRLQRVAASAWGEGSGLWHVGL